MFKVIVAGSRDFKDYPMLKTALDRLLMIKLPDVEIVSGEASGADSLGERYAKEKGLSVKGFPADWKGNGKAAGPIRNRQMAEYADACVVFMKKEGSRGSLNMIEEAEARGLQVRVMRY